MHLFTDVMFIEQPPTFYRLLFPHSLWRLPASPKCIYLTFDDGPIPEVTPWVLDVLDSYGVKATFFMVGDNVRKHPEVFRMVVWAIILLIISKVCAIGRATTSATLSRPLPSSLPLFSVRPTATCASRKRFSLVGNTAL